MQIRINRRRVREVLDTVIDQYRSNDYPYNLPRARLPQEFLPKRLELGTREHAMFLFCLCYYMRGGKKSVTSAKDLAKLYDLVPDLFEAEFAVEQTEEFIRERLEAVGLHFLKNFVPLAWIENARYLEKAQDEIHFLRDQVQAEKGWHNLIAKSPLIIEKLDLIERVAKTDSSVLILGESGVGKELFAEQVHLRSGRAANPFVRVNCAALPEGLLESELFGHVKGAFTDAVQNRRGRFELADTGTIFLDEIGDLPLKLQAKLLRVLQQRSFERVGSSDQVTVDVRIVAATNRDIEDLVEKGEFRSDLYYRLNVLPLHVPPLRQRKEDIPALADFFLKKFSRETNKRFAGFTETAMDLMLSYSWPGNVRELENAVERALVVGRGQEIRPSDFSFQFQADEPRGGQTLDDIERAHIERVLRETQHNLSRAARILDIDRTTLYNKLRRYGLR